LSEPGNPEERQLIITNVTVSLGTVILFASWVLVAGDQAAAFAGALAELINDGVGWLYVVVATAFLTLLLWLAISRHGDLVLGGSDQTPEFSTPSWLAMLFCAGMGTGLLTWGSAAPLWQYLHPLDAEPGSLAAARTALVTAAFPFGLHGWGIYGLSAVAVALGSAGAGRGLRPAVGIFDDGRARLRSIAEIIATLAVLFGVGAALGAGVLQIDAALQRLHPWPLDAPWRYGLIVAAITLLFVLAAMGWRRGGIRLLSILTVALTLLLLGFVLSVGTPLFDLKLFIDGIGRTLANLPALSFHTDPFALAQQDWSGDPTQAHFNGWIAWAPFVGVFVARISRGRTLRALVLGGLILPALFSLFAFAVIGGTTLHLATVDGLDVAGPMLAEPSLATLHLLRQLPIAEVAGLLLVLLLWLFLVTSASAANVALAAATSSGGRDPGLAMILLWAIALTAFMALPLVTGGLAALRAATVITALPCLALLILMAARTLVRMRGAAADAGRTAATTIPLPAENDAIASSKETG
jgi:choline-glycine betaine transporter